MVAPPCADLSMVGRAVLPHGAVEPGEVERRIVEAASLQVASTTEVLGHRRRGAVRVRMDHRPTPRWFEARRAVRGNDGGEREMLGGVTRPSAYATAMVGDDVVSGYLQMERDNAPALRLYERAGFRELCGYHYRAPRPLRPLSEKDCGAAGAVVTVRQRVTAM